MNFHSNRRIIIIRYTNSLDSVFKFNGTWFPFGKLKSPRQFHSSIYWNESVYVIGGTSSPTVVSGAAFEWQNWSLAKTKIEIWNINDSPDKFVTKENWPELFSWRKPHLFIVPDSFFPDYPRPTV